MYVRGPQHSITGGGIPPQYIQVGGEIPPHFARIDAYEPNSKIFFYIIAKYPVLAHPFQINL